jgi:hypothetical protein
MSWHLPGPLYADGDQDPKRTVGQGARTIETQLDRVGRQVSTMAGLADLEITLHNFETAGSKLLVPLRAVHVENFLVAMVWPKDLGTRDAPFQFRRLRPEADQSIDYPDWMSDYCRVSTSSEEDELQASDFLCFCVRLPCVISYSIVQCCCFQTL